MCLWGNTFLKRATHLSFSEEPTHNKRGWIIQSFPKVGLQEPKHMLVDQPEKFPSLHIKVTKDSFPL